MATIPKSGIALSQVIEPQHTLNIINALDGTDTTDIVISGSLTSLQLIATGSLKGSASYALSSSYALTASYAANVPVTASYALTASYLTGYVSPFPYTGSAIITGSLQVTGSIVTGLYSKTQSNKVNIASSATTTILSIPSGSSAGSVHMNYVITNGTDRVVAGNLILAYVVDGSQLSLSDVRTNPAQLDRDVAVTLNASSGAGNITIDATETDGRAYTIYYTYTLLNNSF